MSNSTAPTLTNRDVLNIFDVLSRLSSVVASPEFAYATALNRAKLQPIVAAIQQARQAVTPDCTRFATVRSNLLTQFAQKRPDGNLLVNATGHVLITDPAAFDKAEQDARAADPTGAAAYDEHESRIESLLAANAGGPTAANLQLTKVRVSSLPSMTAADVTTIMPMIQED